MAFQTLYAYVDGSDLHEVADLLLDRLRAFVESDGWLVRKPSVVNQRRTDDPTLGPEDFPDWELGLNLELPKRGDEPPGWFSDVEKIARFLGELHSTTGRDFVIGIGGGGPGFSEDLFFVRSASPDVGWLKSALGVKDRSS